MLIISDIGTLLLLVNTICFTSHYHKNSSIYRVFTLYLIAILSVQTISSYLSILKKDNLFLSHFYFIGQFIILSFFFKKIIKFKSIDRLINLILIITLIMLGFYYYFDPSKYFKFSLFEIILTSFPLIIYSFIFLSQKRKTSSKKYTYIILSFFIYLLCSTLLFLNGNIKSELMSILWSINAFLFVLYQVLIFFNWYKHFRKKALVIPTEKK